MIKVTKLSGGQFYVNTDLIEIIESIPDTLITLTTGNKLIVKESVEEIIEKIVEFKRKILQNDYK